MDEKEEPISYGEKARCAPVSDRFFLYNRNSSMNFILAQIIEPE